MVIIRETELIGYLKMERCVRARAGYDRQIEPIEYSVDPLQLECLFI